MKQICQELYIQFNSVFFIYSYSALNNGHSHKTTLKNFKSSLRQEEEILRGTLSLSYPTEIICISNTVYTCVQYVLVTLVVYGLHCIFTRDCKFALIWTHKPTVP